MLFSSGTEDEQSARPTRSTRTKQRAVPAAEPVEGRENLILVFATLWCYLGKYVRLADYFTHTHTKNDQLLAQILKITREYEFQKTKL